MSYAGDSPAGAFHLGWLEHLLPSCSSWIPRSGPELEKQHHKHCSRVSPARASCVAQWLYGVCLGVGSYCKVREGNRRWLTVRFWCSLFDLQRAIALRLGVLHVHGLCGLCLVCANLITLPNATWVGTVKRGKGCYSLTIYYLREREKKVCDHNLLGIWKGTGWKFNPGVAVPDINNITSFLHGSLYTANVSLTPT